MKKELREAHNTPLPPEQDRMELNPEVDSLVRQVEQHQKELHLLAVDEFEDRPELIAASLYHELASTVSQMQELKSVLTGQLTNLQAQLELASALKADREALQERLNVELLDQEAQFRNQMRSNLTAKQAEKINLETKNRQLLKALARFVDSYYPRPSPDDAVQVQKKKRAAPDREPARPLLTLKTILSDLMNQAVVQPQSPWVVLGEEHWPPYIELLVRADIATFDSTGNRIRLVSI